MEDVNWKTFVVPIIILFIFIGGIIGIVNWQKSKQAPQVVMSVNLPEGEVQSADKDITVNGKVKKGDKVLVNGEEAKVESDGSFSRTVTLNEGANKITIKNQRGGKDVETVERTVKYTPMSAPQTTTETPAPETPASGDVGLGQAPQAGTPSNLSTSGPEEVIIPVIGVGGVVLATVFYLRSRKKLQVNLRK